MRITYVVVKEYVSNDDNEPNMVVAIILLVRGILEGRIDSSDLLCSRYNGDHFIFITLFNSHNNSSEEGFTFSRLEMRTLKLTVRE